MPYHRDEEYLNTLFEYAPISLWEQDFSQIKKMFDELRGRGIVSLDSYLTQHPDFVLECMQQIRVVNVNKKTVSMCAAGSREELLENLDRVFRDGMRHHFRAELLALWNEDVSWSGEGLNYTLKGDAINIRLHWRILPEFEQSWERVLVTVEDVTAMRQAERRFQSLFEASPISLWEEDYSAIKAYFDMLRADGVIDLKSYLEVHPDAALYCASLIKVLNVNQKTLDMFGAASKEHLLQNLDHVFRDGMSEHFSEELVDLWNGRLEYEREGINYSLNGEPIDIQLNFRVMPGHEQDFRWVLVSIQDITARKKAESYLHYLGTHDVMTGLYNRAYFEETVQKIEASRIHPVSIIIIDLNDLKRVNDSLGHQAGDKLIRRVAEVLMAALGAGGIAARIGGDEFVVILPGVDSENTAETARQIQMLVALNNKYYREPELSISLGYATSTPDTPLVKVINLADDEMYRSKGEYHRRRSDDSPTYS